MADTHFGARGDSQLFLNQAVLFFENIFIPHLLKEKIDTVIHFGDIVDRRKYINFQVLHVVRNRILSLFKKHGITIHLIIGNHDTYYKNSQKVNAPSELFSDLDFLKIYTEPQEVVFDGTPILFVPWITDETEEAAHNLLENSRATVACGHFQITGYEMFNGIFSSEGMSQTVFSKFEAVFSGHFHHKSKHGNISYLGSPYELTFNELESRKGFHIFDTDTLKVAFIRNNNRMFYKHVYNDADKSLEEVLDFDGNVYTDKFVKIVVEHKENGFFFDAFVEEIRRQNPHDISIVDFTEMDFSDAEIDENHETHNTMDILFDQIDNLKSAYIKTPDERNILKELMHKLYLEAHEMDATT